MTSNSKANSLHQLNIMDEKDITMLFFQTPELAIILFKELGIKKNKIKRLIIQYGKHKYNETKKFYYLKKSGTCMSDESNRGNKGISIGYQFSPGRINLGEAYLPFDEKIREYVDARLKELGIIKDEL